MARRRRDASELPLRVARPVGNEHGRAVERSREDRRLRPINPPGGNVQGNKFEGAGYYVCPEHEDLNDDAMARLFAPKRAPDRSVHPVVVAREAERRAAARRRREAAAARKARKARKAQR